MDGKKAAAAVVGAALFCLCGFARVEADAGPTATATSAPATRAAPTMAQLIAAIRKAKDPDSAAVNYAQAREIDKGNTGPHEAYMRKMLKLGYPRIALYPAMEMTRLRAENGTAWGVVGYNHARRGKYLLAFTSTMRGMELLAGDPGIQRNAGALLAWYESLEMKPRLSEALETLLAERSKKWLESAKFAQAYQKAKSDISARVQRVKKLKDDAASAEKAARAVAHESSRAINRYRDHSQKIADLQVDVKALKSRLAILDRDDAEADSYGGRKRDMLKMDLTDKIRNKERRIRDLKKGREGLRKYAMEKMEALRAAKKALAKATAALKAQQRSVPSLTWSPPAIDGVITPEAKSRPVPSVGMKATTQSRPWEQVEVQLKMAKLLLRNNRIAEAAGVLRTIIKLHPNTPAAKEAQALLYKHKLPLQQ